MHFKLDQDIKGIIDFSRHDVDITTSLTRLKETDFIDRRAKMFNGDIVNISENRAAHHTALRAPRPPQDVANALKHMHDICERVKNSPITDIVHIGIGGSYTGPEMVCHALCPDAKIHFIANIDAHPLDRLLKTLNRETTLFLIASKTFTTLETMQNAKTMRSWLNKDNINAHFIALTSNADEARDFGIDDENILPLWDWVGGRYSLWSTIGLPIALAGGFDMFTDLLAGAHIADQHFLEAALPENIPVIMALIGDYYRQNGSAGHAVVPYDSRLKLFVDWLQQLDMESNGKISPHGDKTAPIIFGGVGTIAQHSFFQLLHQSNSIIPVDFIGFKNADHSYPDHHRALLLNMLAQSQALQKEKRPSTTFLFDHLNAKTLGYLLALYEHKIFTQSVLWGVNAFDQPGVELGKQIAKAFEKGDDMDDCAAALYNYLKD